MLINCMEDDILFKVQYIKNIPPYVTIALGNNGQYFNLPIPSINLSNENYLEMDDTNRDPIETEDGSYILIE
jgi:hypothetical protein